MGLEVFPQADEGDEQRRSFEEAHVIDVHAMLVEGTPVKDGDDRIDVGCIGSQGDQYVHVRGAPANRPECALVKMPPNHKLQASNQELTLAADVGVHQTLPVP